MAHQRSYSDDVTKAVVKPSSTQDDDEDVFLGVDHSTHTKSSSRKRYMLIGGAVILVVVVVGVAIGAVAGGGGGGSDGSSSVNGGAGPAPSPGAPRTPAPTTELESIFRLHSEEGGSEFDDPDSYQSKALRWVEGNPPPPMRTIPTPTAPNNNNRREWQSQDELDRTFQRFALACLYYATNLVENEWTRNEFGKLPEQMAWVNSDGWMEPNTDECTWSLVVCNERGQVEQINMEANRLTGQFPHEITYLRESLRVLDIGRNWFYNNGELPNTFLGELTALEFLYTGQSNFHYDGIPTQIGQLTNLIDYDCSYSLYFGELDDSIFENLNSLEYLYLSGNSFNSTIPSTLARLPNLKYVYIANTDITGKLEDLLTVPNGFRNIVELWVDKNPKLTGFIPTEVGELSNLRSFSTTECGLGGQLPTELGRLDKMKQLWFYLNDFTGAIPTELGALSLLDRLEVEATNLAGPIPQEICDRRSPIGQLEVLEAECDICPDNCCSCCGQQCLGDRSDPNTAGGGGGRERRRLELLRAYR